MGWSWSTLYYLVNQICDSGFTLNWAWFWPKVVFLGGGCFHSGRWSDLVLAGHSSATEQKLRSGGMGRKWGERSSGTEQYNHSIYSGGKNPFYSSATFFQKNSGCEDQIRGLSLEFSVLIFLIFFCGMSVTNDDLGSLLLVLVMNESYKNNSNWTYQNYEQERNSICFDFWITTVKLKYLLNDAQEI